MSARAPRTHQGGFTLVELLVVMVLLSMVMLAMGSALHTTAQTEERVDVRLQRADEMRVAVDFLRSTLGRVSMVKTAAPVNAGPTPYLFTGLSSQLTWVGVMSARFGAGGRFHFRLAIETAQRQQALVLRFAPWADEAVAPNWNLATAHVLVADATGLALRYQDAYVDPPQWLPEWTAPDHLPDRVSVSLQTVSGAWPEVVVPLRPLVLSDPSAGGGGAVFGGVQ